MTVRRETEGAVTRVTLDRADAMNSFDLDHARQLSDEITAAMKEDASDAVLLDSAGERAFSTGADLNHFQQAIEEDRAREVVREVSSTMNEAILRVVHGDKPVIGCIEGVAAGGGLGLALSCDIRVASTQARFTPAFLGSGVSPDGGATWFLPRMIGAARARDLILRNRIIDADTALEWGLVAEVADDANQAALDVARKLAEGPSKAISWTKDRLIQDHALDEHLNYETQATAASAETEDFREGIEAFLDGREPQFE